jgi:NCAIR mutase (PurE)-related protein
MDEKFLKNILENVQSHELSIDEAITKLRYLPFEDLGFVTIDHHRSLRQGFPSASGAGKRPRNRSLRSLTA